MHSQEQPRSFRITVIERVTYPDWRTGKPRNYTVGWACSFSNEKDAMRFYSCCIRRWGEDNVSVERVY
jgi:hypothetical protein